MRVSNLRLVVFLAAVAAILPTVRGLMSPWWYAAFASAFVALVVVHARVLGRIDQAKRVRQIYERGLARIEGRWAGAGPTGARFQREDHPFARDLDLFGRASLFQLLDTARTDSGEETLAAWLLTPARPDEIRARQAAVDELRTMVDYREALAIVAAGAHVGKTSAVARWAASPPAALPILLGMVLAASATVTVLLSAAVLAGGLDWHLLSLWVAAQAGLALLFRRRVQRVLASVGWAVQDLDLLAELLSLVESQKVSSPRLLALRQSLYTEGVPPSRRIAELRRAMTWLDSTTNQILIPIARYLALRTQIAVVIDRWRARYGASVAAWLAGDRRARGAVRRWRRYAYEHPADPFPELVEGAPSSTPTASAIRCCSKHRGAQRRAARRRWPARADRQRLEHVRQEHAAARRRRQRGAGAGRRAGARARACGCRRWRSARRSASRTRCRTGTSRFYAEILAAARRSSSSRAARPPAAVPARRDPAAARTRTTAASAPRPIVRDARRGRRDRPRHHARPRADRARRRPRRARRPTCTSRIASRTAGWSSTTACGRASSSAATRWRSCARSVSRSDEDANCVIARLRDRGIVTSTSAAAGTRFGGRARATSGRRPRRRHPRTTDSRTRAESRRGRA